MKFKVYTIPHTIFAAAHLVDQLNKQGHRAELVRTLNPFDTTVYIIYNPAVVRQRLPPNYIVYQTEIGTSRWFSERYFKIIAGAIAVWDYSPQNVTWYQHVNKNVFIVTPGIAPQEVIKKDIDVTFYGWIKGCERRLQLLKDIGNKIPLKIVTDAMGNKMWQILRRTKVVLNIHFYQNSPLEVFRLNEALSFDCHVVSEGPEAVRYSGLVEFASGADALVEKINQMLKKDFDLPLSKLDNTEEIKAAVAALHEKPFASSSLKAIMRKV